MFCYRLFLDVSNRYCSKAVVPPRAVNDYFSQCTQRLFLLALAPSTRRSYATGMRAFHRFLQFTRRFGPIWSNLDIRTVQHSIVYCLRVLNVRSTTVRMYLAALRYYCSINQFPDPLHDFNGNLKFSINTLLKAADKVQKPSRPLRLPIDILLLSRMCVTLDGSYFDSYWDALFKAVLSCAFFGFLRPGEFTTQQFHPSRNLTLSDISVERNSFLLYLKRSKSDRLNRGVSIRYFSLHSTVCPMANLRRYLQLRSRRFTKTAAAQTPLFLMPNGRALSRTEFISRLRRLLFSLGYNALRYSGHSLRIGAASSAASAGVSSDLIKVLGRWSSDAYQRYIRLPSSTVADAFCLISRLHA